MFNTLQYAKKLEEVGVSRDQAEAHVQIIAEIIEGDVATKEDIKNLETVLRQDMKSLEHKVEASEFRVVIKLGAVIGAAATLLLGAIALLLQLH